MPPPVTRDPSDPAFPHGESRGYLRGCKTEEACPRPDITCRAAFNRSRKRQAVNRSRGVGRYATPRQEQACREHAISLLAEHPTATRQRLGNLTGVNPDDIRQFLAGQRSLGRKSILALLAVTSEALRDDLPWVDGSDAITAARRLAAQGFSLAWQSHRLGMNVQKVVSKPRMTERSRLKILSLAREVGSRMATPADGTTERSIEQAVAWARRHGFYPTAFYDDDGTLDWRSIADHRWTPAEVRAGRFLDDARTLIDGWVFGSKALGELRGHTSKDSGPRRFERIALALRVRECDPFREIAAGAALALIDQASSPGRTAVEIALLLDLITTRNIHHDHPGVIAWQQRQHTRRQALLALARLLSAQGPQRQGLAA